MIWRTFSVTLRAWLLADSQFAPLVMQSDANGPFSAIGLGVPPVAEAPCVWIARGRDGERNIALTDHSPQLPGQFTLTVELWAVMPHGDTTGEELDLAQAALAVLEDAFVASLKRFFAPDRNVSSVLGGAYRAIISQAIPLADNSNRPQVGSLFTIVINKDR